MEKKAKKSKSMKVRKAVILAGGLGTRFLPATLVVAKELFPICEQPILMYHLEDLARAGITDVLIVGNKLKQRSFKNFISPPGDYLKRISEDGKDGFLEKYSALMKRFNSVSYINQEVGELIFKENGGRGCVRGSSVAILACKRWVRGEPFLVVNGDDFCVYGDNRSVAGELIDLFERTGDYIVYGKEVDRDLISKYSSMALGEKIGPAGCFKMADIIEKPLKGTEPSNIMGFARYIFGCDIFDKILSSSPRQNGEYCITDVLTMLAREGRVSTRIFGGLYYDCGSRLGLQMAGNYVLFAEEGEKNALISQFDMLKSNFI